MQAGSVESYCDMRVESGVEINIKVGVLKLWRLAEKRIVLICDCILKFRKHESQEDVREAVGTQDFHRRFLC